MYVTGLTWAITVAVIVGLFAFDLVVNARSPRAPRSANRLPGQRYISAWR
jgi:hypothetical protein